MADGEKKTKIVESSSVLSNSIDYKVIESTLYREQAQMFKIGCNVLKIPVEDVALELDTINTAVIDNEKATSSKDQLMEKICSSVEEMSEMNSQLEENLCNLPNIIMKKAEQLDEENKKYECTVPVDDIE